MESSSFSSLAALTTTVIIVEKLHHKNWTGMRDENEEVVI